MSNIADRELRRELLLKALKSESDPQMALELAREMERFVLFGSGSMRVSPPPHVTTSDQRPTKVDVEMTVTDENSLQHKRGPKPRWSKADDQTLTEAWHDGLPVREIAARIGRTESSVLVRARRMGFSSRRPAGAPEGHQQVKSNGSSPNDEAAPEPDPGRKTAHSGPQCELGATFDKRTKVRVSRLVEFGAQANRQALCAKAKVGTPKRSLGRTRGILEGDKRGTVSRNIMAFTMEPVIAFMRSRDYSVVRADDGDFLVDGHSRLSANELLLRANRLRQSLKKPEFEIDRFL